MFRGAEIGRGARNIFFAVQRGSEVFKDVHSCLPGVSAPVEARSAVSSSSLERIGTAVPIASSQAVAAELSNFHEIFFSYRNVPFWGPEFEMEVDGSNERGRARFWQTRDSMLASKAQMTGATHRNQFNSLLNSAKLRQGKAEASRRNTSSYC